MDWQIYFSAILFITVYAFIVTEKIHRTVVALLGAVLTVAFGVLTQTEAVAAVDFNTIGLLIGMMILVGITRRSGVFEFLAIYGAQKTKGDPVKLLVVLATITALASAFLDNVTTVLLVVPVTFAITEKLGVHPFPYLLVEILASNIGGTATLIGDPPNIMIGGGTGLGFMDFLVNLTPVVVIVFAVTISICVLLFRKRLEVAEAQKELIMNFHSREAIRDYVLMKKSVSVLALVMLGFVIHQYVGLEPATVALLGAALLMCIARENEPEDILLTVEWPTIFFFVGLFILVGSLEKVGIIEAIARKLMELTHGSMGITAILILWMSAIFSAFVDNIPFTATMIPLIKSIGQLTGGALDPLWWSLALGACLGGNGTIIGASANVVVSGISAQHGHNITFMDYLKYGFPLMLLSIIISTLYVWLRYLT